MVLIASILALPIAWSLSEKWLATVAYRSALPLWLFGVTGTVTALIALVVVGMQSLKAAQINPAESLKTD